MTDPVTAARSARENLAQGLAALQSPGVPAQLMDVAEPIAQAMSALHHIESSQGAAAASSAPSALDAVRRALAMLQAQPGGHAAVDKAIESVAGSLGLIHSLTQHVPVAPMQPQAAFAGTVVMDHQAHAPMSAAPATQPSAPAPYAAPAQQPQWQQPVQQQAPQQPPPQQQWAPPPAQPAPPAQAWQPPPPQQAAPPPQQAAWGAQQPQQAYGAPPQQWQQPQQPQAAPPPQPQQQWAPPTAQPAYPAGGGGPAVRVDAELGAHSSTNFYKGLSGNDVIDSGGIFIATYQIPAIGQELVIKVSLPGGYEFEATGVVRWTRDAPNSGADSPPGFGAQFTQISPEGRQLVYRYVRNREPLFHDDL